MTAGGRSADLDALIDELTVDAYNEEEQLTGFLTGSEDALQSSEKATIVGVTVQVVAVTAGPDVRRGVVAVCERESARHEVSLADLRFEPNSRLGLVANAYRRWLGCG